MREFDHPHILTLIGIALDKDCDMPLVVLPFMRHGDLLSFIRDDMNVSVLHYPKIGFTGLGGGTKKGNETKSGREYVFL